MKTAKKVLLIILSILMVFSCKRYTEPEGSNVANEEENGSGLVDGGNNGGGGSTIEDETGPLTGSGVGISLGSFTLPKNSLSQEEQNKDYDPTYNHAVLFANGGIPALTTTSKGALVAAVGYEGNILVKKSLDSGKTWFISQVATETPSRNPFFINCHNGDVLLGVTTYGAGFTNTIFYRSTDDGGSWTKQGSLVKVSDIDSKVTSNFVIYGQGVTLRHGANAGKNKLLFPYSYSTNKYLDQTQWTMTINSSDDGKKWDIISNRIKGTLQISGNPFGDFSAYENKIYETSEGNILLNLRTPGNLMYWGRSTNYGKDWVITTIQQQEKSDNDRHADLVRYEFNGKPIKGPKYGLMAYSTQSGQYKVRLTDNDFNNGDKSGSKYKKTEIIVADTGITNGYPAITVLPDGTIGTLTEEMKDSSANIIFRRFNLYWLTYGSEKVDYSTLAY